MSILIRGMDMPKTCFDCAWRCKVDPETLLCRISGEYFDETFSNSIAGRYKNCPLVKVPPYTRLIDAETLYCRLVNEPIRAVDGAPYDVDWWTRIADAYEQAIDAVEQAPTIIEAEGEEEND